MAASALLRRAVLVRGHRRAVHARQRPSAGQARPFPQPLLAPHRSFLPRHHHSAALVAALFLPLRRAVALRTHIDGQHVPHRRRGQAARTFPRGAELARELRLHPGTDQGNAQQDRPFPGQPHRQEHRGHRRRRGASRHQSCAGAVHFLLSRARRRPHPRRDDPRPALRRSPGRAAFPQVCRRHARHGEGQSSRGHGTGRARRSHLLDSRHPRRRVLGRGHDRALPHSRGGLGPRLAAYGAVPHRHRPVLAGCPAHGLRRLRHRSCGQHSPPRARGARQPSFPTFSCCSPPSAASSCSVWTVLFPAPCWPCSS